MSSRTRTLAMVAAAAALAGPLGACGGSSNRPDPAPAVLDDRREILATVDALQTASRDDDARRICHELFAASLAQSIRKSSKRSCEAEVSHTLTSPDAQLSVAREIDVKGVRATGTIREQNGDTSRVSFVKDSGRWRIERITRVKP
jgi:hypothetical protein